jgi:hypothetical protein
LHLFHAHLVLSKGRTQMARLPALGFTPMLDVQINR